MWGEREGPLAIPSSEGSGNYPHSKLAAETSHSGEFWAWLRSPTLVTNTAEKQRRMAAVNLSPPQGFIHTYRYLHTDEPTHTQTCIHMNSALTGMQKWKNKNKASIYQAIPYKQKFENYKPTSSPKCLIVLCSYFNFSVIDTLENIKSSRKQSFIKECVKTKPTLSSVMLCVLIIREYHTVPTNHIHFPVNPGSPFQIYKVQFVMPVCSLGHVYTPNGQLLPYPTFARSHQL